ncbi:LOW QUALITY PROTEIN: morphogenesis protein (Msb1) [Purpureocillium lavendulum]|uniref:Morphogenesis protein (Msb1) n=1 Tax=Purpureocillium lavendulum TaxID=1247861 RepID=A0AB34FX62_9HYPO|nr:LOW QUALITY PROTEIN: morphogenesis protein (Msb1) [Purpureocillium lavendulum]
MSRVISPACPPTRPPVRLGDCDCDCDCHLFAFPLPVPTVYPPRSRIKLADPSIAMPGLFSRLKARDGLRSKKKQTGNDLANALPAKPKWDDAYTRKTVEPEEIHELLHYCTEELKARGLDLPFLLLPFRPTSDPSAVRTFVRHFFDHGYALRGETLVQELRMTEPMVISGVVKWCWSRLQGGVVGWDAYELFKVGEYDSNKARDSFKTFIPISVENGARQRIIFDFFDLIAAVAAHGKSNGFGGRQLSRMAAWWAFEHKDTGSGFDGGYKAWLSAADATSHLFFAYLRSLTPEQSPTGISLLPRSLEKLLKDTAYPPPRSQGMMTSTNKLVMMVDAVSPTPFALLRRAGHFQYRDTDHGLQEFSNYEDPVKALTEECLRVLKAISAANQSQASSVKHSTSLRDASWSRFEDMGFSTPLAEEEEDTDENGTAPRHPQAMRRTPAPGNDLARPTTPSWADFLSSGFVDDNGGRPNLLLPPDKVLPPIETGIRQHSSSQSHRPRLESDRHLEPGELASITIIELDDAFWWVWMSSLAPEETADRKSAFGRCALIETRISSARWIVMEEMVAGAAPEPQEGAYIAEKKSFFSWTKRSKTLRRKSIGKHALEREANGAHFGDSKTSVGGDTHARVQAKAAQLRAMKDREQQAASQATTRRGRTDAERLAEKTNSVFTLQPHIVGEASSAMKWVKKYDKGTIKDAYMANSNAGRGLAVSPAPSEHTNGASIANGSIAHGATAVGANGHAAAEQSGPEVPAKDVAAATTSSIRRDSVQSPPPETVETPKQATPEPVEQPASPPPPPKDIALPVVAAVEADELNAAPESRKLQKANLPANKEKSGLRKLFARKQRASKLPENAPAEVNEMLRQAQHTPEPPVQQTPTPAATPSRSMDEETAVRASGDSATPAASTPRGPVTPPAQDSDVPKSAEQTLPEGGNAESRDEFSRFDQGPLADQPAFVPEDDEDDATPPPIARHPPRQETLPASETPKEELSQSAGPGVQDRWAQIRKNAAQRAAVRPKEETTRSSPSRTGDGDDDTSGEENPTLETIAVQVKQWEPATFATTSSSKSTMVMPTGPSSSESSGSVESGVIWRTFCFEDGGGAPTGRLARRGSAAKSSGGFEGRVGSAGGVASASAAVAVVSDWDDDGSAVEAPTGRLGMEEEEEDVGGCEGDRAGGEMAVEVAGHPALLPLDLARGALGRRVEVDELALGVLVLHADDVVLFNVGGGADADEAAHAEDLAGELGVAQVAADALAEVDVLEAVDAVDALEARDAEGEAVHAVDEAEDHVVLRVDVEDATRDDGPQGAPVAGGRGRGGADEDHVGDEAEGVALGEGLQAGVDGGGAEGVADEGDGALALDAVDEGVGEEAARLVGAVAGAAEGVVDARRGGEDLDGPEGGPERGEDGALDDLALEGLPRERADEVAQRRAEREQRLHLVPQREDLRVGVEDAPRPRHVGLGVEPAVDADGDAQAALVLFLLLLCRFLCLCLLLPFTLLPVVGR